ncbi:MAG TPA: hypothetical protein VM008_19865 [Phycisphaerae bacterium]|nr:hypothetical protein [Phycisphaerae bacterium]
MNAESAKHLSAEGQPARTHLLARVPWPLVLFAGVLILLLLDRYRYLTHFGFLYTDGDQTTFWYQANDVAHGIFREPCVYGQDYNPPVEAWVAAPLLRAGVPAYVALPVVTVALALLPFVVLGVLAYRRGQRWGASVILLIPLALPIEYAVVSSLPRGFVNGIAVATPAVACWVFGKSRGSFLAAGFFAVLGLTVNPNCSIVLLAAGVFALLTHWRSWKFYLFSFLGGLAAAPAPILISLFYRWHPQVVTYRPKVGSGFSWDLLRNSLIVPGRKGVMLAHAELDLFFADFVPVVGGGHRGWVMLLVLPALVVLLLFVKRMRAAVAVLAASVFAIVCLGCERIHSADFNVFYPGSRMYLALPVLMALAWLWFDAGLRKRSKGPPGGRTLNVWAVGGRVVAIAALLGFAWCRRVGMLEAPSPFVTQSFLPPVESVERLRTDSKIVAEACRKYDVSLVLVGPGAYTCMNEGGPVLAHGSFETFYPYFERRTFLVAEERVKRHTAVLLYEPGWMQMAAALRRYPGCKVVSRLPALLLVKPAAPGETGLDVAAALGLVYRPNI